MKRVFAFFFVALSACSSSSNDTPSVTIAQACADAQATVCQRFQECAPFFVTLTYGDVATCQSRAILGCTSFTTAPGSTTTPDELQACVNAVKKLSCDQILNGGLSSAPECDVKGTLDNGKPCAQGLQCTSGWCPIGTSGCGTCAPKTKAGDACVAGSCSDGLSCVKTSPTDTGTCAAYVDAGGDCSASGTTCKSGYACVSGKCTADAKDGDACGGTSGVQCDLAQGDVCSSTSKTCTKITLPTVGQPCDVSTFFVCAGSAVCSSKTGSGTCVAPADDGQACDEAKGPGCKPGAKCVSGVCKVPDVTTCK